MAALQSRKHTYRNSGRPYALLDDKIGDHATPKQPKITGIKNDRALFAEHNQTLLLSAATRTDLTESIGTLLSNVQLSTLDKQQLDELALLVSERGVVFFRDQDLAPEEHVRILERFGTFSKDTAGKEPVSVKSKSATYESIENLSYTPSLQRQWHASRSFKSNPPSYSLLKVEEDVGGETAWVSQYGLYDALSKHMRGFLDGLSAIHTSQLHDNWNRAPIETHHPAVRTHPVTGFKALNVTAGSVTGFAELKKKESDKLLEFLDYHILSEAEHSVRFKWEAGSVAIWDNRCTAHRAIAGSSTETRVGVETHGIGEQPYFDPHSESRDETVQRLAKEEKDACQRWKENRARFNNTPLRRIIQRQIHGETLYSNAANQFDQERKSEEQSVPELSVERKSQEPQALPEASPKTLTRELKTEQWAKEVISEKVVTIVEKEISPEKETLKRAGGKSSNSPLRRIIQRQVSGNSGPRRRDWK